MSPLDRQWYYNSELAYVYRQIAKMDAAEKELLDVLSRNTSSEKESFSKTDVKVGYTTELAHVGLLVDYR